MFTPTSPATLVFVGVLVCAGFAGWTRNTNTSALGSHGHIHHHSQSRHNSPASTRIAVNADLKGQSVPTSEEATTVQAWEAANGLDGDGAEHLIEEQFKKYLQVFKDYTSTDLMDRASKTLAKVAGYVKNGTDDAHNDFLPGSLTIDEVKSISAKVTLNQNLRTQLETLDAAPDPEWMNSGSSSRRRLLGSGNKGIEIMKEVSDSLNISLTNMQYTFPIVVNGLTNILVAIEAQEEGATVQADLVYACLNLGAVAARAAPKPFGKDVPKVFDLAYGAVHDMLPHIDIERVTALIKAALGKEE